MKSSLLPYLDDSGKLMSYAWPGMYPLFYIDTGCNASCPDCANKEAITPDLRAARVNWEDASLYCDECSKRIESAYAEEGTTDNGQ